MFNYLFRAALLAALSGSLSFAPAAQAEDFFVPSQPRPPAQPAAPRPQPRPQPPVVPQAAPPGEEQPPPPLQVQLPPVPEVPDLQRTSSPPAAVFGVLGVPEIMHASTAAQQAQKIIFGRRDKLNEDAQKEQAAWHDMQQALANERTRLSPEQIRTRERELQERITRAQHEFRERATILQQTNQYVEAQIERALNVIVGKVAESRGINVVLYRQQVVVNAPEFDITPQVVELLNKVLQSVIIPPDGVSPAAIAPPAPGAPAAAGTPAPAAAPAPATGGTRRR